MANHDWNAMTSLAIDATAAGAGSTAAHATTALLVDAGRASWQGAGCGSAGGFGDGGLLAIVPALLAAVLLRRVAKRRSR